MFSSTSDSPSDRVRSYKRKIKKKEKQTSPYPISCRRFNRTATMFRFRSHFGPSLLRSCEDENIPYHCVSVQSDINFDGVAMYTKLLVLYICFCFNVGFINKTCITTIMCYFNVFVLKFNHAQRLASRHCVFMCLASNIIQTHAVFHCFWGGA